MTISCIALAFIAVSSSRLDVPVPFWLFMIDRPVLKYNPEFYLKIWEEPPENFCFFPKVSGNFSRRFRRYVT